jgi:hypothetical protein
MRAEHPPEADLEPPEAGAPDPLARFRDWRGFLLAAMAVNALFVWGMLGQVSDPATVAWHKTLVWLPFNTIATAIYYAILVRLTRPGATRAGAMFYFLLCCALIVANWAIMLAA